MTNYFFISSVFFIFLFVLYSTYFFKKKTNTFSLSIPLWIIFFWTFKGFFDFSVLDLYNLNSNIESELFDVVIGSDYVLSFFVYLVYFLSYVLVSFLYSMYFSPKQLFNPNEVSPKPIISASSYIFIFFSFFVYVVYFLDMINGASSNLMSPYEYSRHYGTQFKSVAYVVGWFFCVSIICLFPNFKRVYKFYFILMIVIFILMSLVLGNRHVVLSIMLFSLVFYSDSKPIDVKKLAFVFFTSIVFLTIMAIASIAREYEDFSFSQINSDDVVFQLLGILNSNEFLASHVSMYYSISNNVDFAYGQSFKFLFSSFLPESLFGERCSDIYNHYIYSILGSIPQKGYTINNATGWYLNGGVIFVAFGGFLVGFVSVMLHKLAYSTSSKSKLKLFYLIIYCAFMADFVGFIRAGGPEPFKGVLLIKGVLTAFVVSMILIKFKLKIKRNK
jgi:hypothetical protein